MAQPKRPTDGELALLQVLWERGPSTVREVLEELEKSEPTGYTTVLKLLQIMTDKGLVARDESSRAHVYRPLVTESATQGRFVTELLDKAFGGSPAKLVQRALSAKKASREELDEIRKLLEEWSEES